MPFMLLCKGNKTTLMDLGHNNMYFFDALVQYLMVETNFKFIFVRIRRERLEGALSLTFKVRIAIF